MHDIFSLENVLLVLIRVLIKVFVHVGVYVLSIQIRVINIPINKPFH